MWACCDDTSSDDVHNTSNTFLLLCADLIAPVLQAGLTEVDELKVVLGCRFALDVFTIQQDYLMTDQEPVISDPELAGWSWSTQASAFSMGGRARASARSSCWRGLLWRPTRGPIRLLGCGAAELSPARFFPSWAIPACAQLAAAPPRPLRHFFGGARLKWRLSAASGGASRTSLRLGTTCEAPSASARAQWVDDSSRWFNGRFFQKKKKNDVKFFRKEKLPEDGECCEKISKTVQRMHQWKVHAPNPLCDSWQSSACQNYRKESGCRFGEKCAFASKKRKWLVVKVLLPYWKIQAIRLRIPGPRAAEIQFEFTEGPRNWSILEILQRLSQPKEKCKQTRKQRCASTMWSWFVTVLSKNWIYSWQWKSSRIRQQFHRLENSAKITDTLVSGPVVKNHILFKTGENTKKHWEFRAHRRSRIINQTSQLVHEYILNISVAGLNGWWFYAKYSNHTKSEHAQSSTERPVARFHWNRKHWKREHRCRTGGARRMICRNVYKNSLIHWKFSGRRSSIKWAFVRISREPLHQEASRVNMMFSYTSRRTETAKNARGRKLQGRLAEDALAKQYIEQSVVTWQQQIAKVLIEGCESWNNHR